MFTHYRTWGIVLKKQDLGEANQLLTIYTRDFGKLQTLAKAVRKVSSKLRSGVELFYLSEVAFVQGKTYKTLTDAILIDKFTQLRNDLKKLRIAHQIAEAADNFIGAPEKDPKIWRLLKECFEKLNSFNKNKTEIIYHYFFWNLISLLGYQPHIQGCSINGKKISCDAVKIIKIILRKDWKILPRLRLESSHLKLLKNVSKWYSVKIHILL